MEPFEWLFGLRGVTLSLVSLFFAGFAGVALASDRIALGRRAVGALMLVGAALFFRQNDVILPALAFTLVAGFAFEAAYRPRIRIPTMLLFAGPTILLLISAVPEVARYWDNSGWRDSNGYDDLAHVISLGGSAWSYYMPVYQYGMAAIYFAFGHFIELQKVLNLLLAAVTVWLFIDTALLLGASSFVAFCVGVVAALSSRLHHEPWSTQIENWYVPAVAAAAWSMALYLKQPTLRRIVGLALFAALVFNIRLQGAFFCAALVVTAFVAHGRGQRAWAHAAVFTLFFAAVGLLPWSIRNYVVEDRFSPATLQGVEHLAIMNDPRIKLYGLRYGENFYDLEAEWRARYPNWHERIAAQRAYFLERLTHDPGWFFKAAPWRVGAFYGVVPAPFFSPGGSLPLGEIPSHLFHHRYVFMFPLAVSLLGLIAAPRRESWFLLLLIGASVFPFTLSTFPDPRGASALYVLHAMLAIAPFTRPGGRTSALAPLMPTWRRAATVGCLAAVTVVALHLSWGRHHANREIKGVFSIDPGVVIDASLPLLDLQPDADVAKRYRALLVGGSGDYPPAWAATVGGTPPQRDGAPYKLFASAVWDGSRWWRSRGIPARLSNTLASAPIREFDAIEAEVTLEKGELSPVGYFLSIHKARVVGAVTF